MLTVDCALWDLTCSSLTWSDLAHAPVRLAYLLTWIAHVSTVYCLLRPFAKCFSNRTSVSQLYVWCIIYVWVTHNPCNDFLCSCFGLITQPGFSWRCWSFKRSGCSIVNRSFSVPTALWVPCQPTFAWYTPSTCAYDMCIVWGSQANNKAWGWAWVGQSLWPHQLIPSPYQSLN